MQDAKDSMKFLRSRGIPCIVMEPNRGGALTSPGIIGEVFKEVHPERYTGSWAIRFAASNQVCYVC